MPVEHPKVILVVPAFNEAARMKADAFAEFLRADTQTHLLFVDDGSTDATRELLEDMARSNPLVSVLSLPRNAGKAEAVRQGVLEAFRRRPEFIGYWDADLATPLSAAADLRNELDRWPQADLVMGARVRLLGRTVERRAVRHYLGRGFATATSLMLGIPVYDTQCGAKLFRAVDRVRNCFRIPFHSRWIFDVELVGRVIDLRRHDAGGIVHEVPLAEWRDAGASKVSLGGFVRAPLELLMIRRALRKRAWIHPRD